MTDETRIDWDRFGARVKVGAYMRQLSVMDTIIWEGMLLENYPYQKEEFFMGHWAKETVQSRMKRLAERPILRYQRFNSLSENTIPVKLDGLQYLIDGTWLTFAQVMGDGE